MSAPPVRVHALIDGLSVGGAEMLLVELAAVAPEEGLDLSVGYLSSRPGTHAVPRLEALGVKPEEVGVRRLAPPDLAATRRQLARIRPDVVHTHMGASDVLGGLAARSLRIPSVSTLHTMRWDAKGKAGLKETLMTRTRRHLMDRVIAVSDTARERYLAEGRDVPGHVVVVRNGVRGTLATGEGRRVREELGIGADELVVSLVATLRPEKAHEVAIEAIRRLRDDGVPVRLLIAGDGPSQADVERAAAASGAGEGVVMAGYRDDVMAVLDATDVLLHAPRFDALPTSVIEAGAAGVPVVGTRVGGIPEIVEDGVTGVLVPPPPEAGALVGALAPLLADRERREALGAAGRKRFEHEFSARSWARRLRTLYREVIEA